MVVLFLIHIFTCYKVCDITMYESDYCSFDQMLLSRKDRQNMIQEKLHNNQHDELLHVKLHDKPF